jgi:hemoglobin-like flavoprotein
MFKSFANVPLDQLQGNKRLEAHAKAVLYAISQLVDNLDDVELIIEMLKRQARNHKSREVTSVMFDNLGKVLLKMLTLSLDERAQAIWAKTYGIIVDTVKETQSKPDDD